MQNGNGAGGPAPAASEQQQMQLQQGYHPYGQGGDNQRQQNLPLPPRMFGMCTNVNQQAMLAWTNEYTRHRRINRTVFSRDSHWMPASTDRPHRAVGKLEEVIDDIFEFAGNVRNLRLNEFNRLGQFLAELRMASSEATPIEDRVPLSDSLASKLVIVSADFENIVNVCNPVHESLSCIRWEQ